MDIILDPSRLGEWLEGVLVGWGLPQGLAVFINLAIGATVILIFALTLVLGLIWLERKVAGRIQDRLLGQTGLAPSACFKPSPMP